MDSRIAVCSWSLRPPDPHDLVGRLQDIGLRAVQLDLTTVCGDSRRWYPVFGLLADAGIQVVSGMMAMAEEDYSTLSSIAETGGLRPDRTWSVNRTRAEMVAALAAETHIELITFHAGFIPESPGDPERGKLLDRLREIADLFGASGLRLAIETGQETAATLLEALDELDRPNVGVNFDPANMILYGMGDPVEALDTLAPRVRQIHVKDAVPTDTPGTWGRELPVGEGAVPWPAFFEVARSIRPHVDFVIEREAGGERVADVVAARDLVARHLDAS